MSAPAHSAACVVLLLLAAALPAGCARFTKQGADTEVYTLLEEQRRVVPALVGSLDVDAADQVASARRRGTAWRLTLEDALELAAAASRDYLKAREDVYLAALDLTGTSNEFHNPLLAALFGFGTRIDRDEVRPEVNTVLSGSRRSESGGSLGVELATGFFSSLLTGDPFDVARSVLQADLTIPMARGSGWVAREPLTQAERDVLYALRAYARFQQEFTVDVVSEYYRLLEDRDTWRNEELTYESLRRLLDRQEAMGALGAGRVPDFEVDQTRQDLLIAENRRLTARTSFESSLDRFKQTLGVPVDVAVEVSDDDLEALRREGPRRVPVDAATAVPVALERRLDLDNVADVEEDSVRRTLVAKNALGPQVDLVLSGSAGRDETSGQSIEELDLEGFFGATIGLPIERTAERNAFRAALILALRARRDREAAQDRVRLEVREALRQVDRAQQSHAIQAQGVRLAQRRVESTDLLLEAGQATTRDRLDAEASLVTARNALTRALVDHAIARLVLLRDVGILAVGTDGRWVEPLDTATAPAGLATSHPPAAAPEADAPGAAPRAGAPPTPPGPGSGAILPHAPR